MITAEYKNIHLDKCVVALGKFQGLHRGHMLLVDKVAEISKENDIPGVILAINVKQEQYINLQNEREAILEKANIDYLAECDFTPEFAVQTPEEFVSDVIVNRLHACYVVVGEDFCFGRARIGNVDLLREFGKKYGFEVVAFSKLAVQDEIVSTSRIRELITEGKVDKAMLMMGRAYEISGTVKNGKKLGRTLGFPTANIIPDNTKLLPCRGVYRTQIVIDDEIYRGMTNVGYNPTVDNDHKVFVESYIKNFNKDIYGKTISVQFLDYMRAEKKFASVEELKKQLEKDKTAI